jgi:hypothetical protein
MRADTRSIKEPGPASAATRPGIYPDRFSVWCRGDGLMKLQRNLHDTRHFHSTRRARSPCAPGSGLPATVVAQPLLEDSQYTGKSVQPVTSNLAVGEEADQRDVAKVLANQAHFRALFAKHVGAAADTGVV